MRCFIVQSPNLEEEEEDSTFNVQRETERDTQRVHRDKDREGEYWGDRKSIYKV
jgi:hypothetical protein